MQPNSSKDIFCYPEGCAATSSVQCQCNARGSLSKLAGVPPRRKINVTSKSPVGDISVVTLIRTDTTLDHSQKAEKVWAWVGGDLARLQVAQATRREQPTCHSSSVGAFWCVIVRMSHVGSEAVVTRIYDQRKCFRHICYEDVLFNHPPHRTRRNIALQFIQPHCADTPHLTWSGSPNNFSNSTMSSSSS
jgi:hypothetical protein